MHCTRYTEYNPELPLNVTVIVPEEKVTVGLPRLGVPTLDRLRISWNYLS